MNEMLLWKFGDMQACLFPRTLIARNVDEARILCQWLHGEGRMATHKSKWSSILVPIYKRSVYSDKEKDE